MWAALGPSRAPPTPDFNTRSNPYNTRALCVSRASLLMASWTALQPIRVRCAQVHVVRVQQDALTLVNVPAAVVQRVHDVRV